MRVFRQAGEPWECPRCGIIKEAAEFSLRPDRASGRRSECKACEYAPRNRGLRYKKKAIELVSYAIKTKRLARASHCEICEQEKMTQAHHQDYNQPLSVNWLCTGCHGKVHSSINAIKKIAI